MQVPNFGVIRRSWVEVTKETTPWLKIKLNKIKNQKSKSDLTGHRSFLDRYQNISKEKKIVVQKAILKTGQSYKNLVLLLS